MKKEMKKLALYIFLILMVCNVGFAECIKGDCNNGQGTYTWESGEYVGEWKDGKRHGQGTHTVYILGSKYAGEWKDGLQHGQGTYSYPDGNKYVGEWKDGKWHGQGTATYANGDKYVGGWKNGLPHGYGTMTNFDGRTVQGIFKDGELIERQE